MSSCCNVCGQPADHAPTGPFCDDNLRIAELEAELAEQARLNGMGSEREAKLQAQLAQAQVRIERLEAALKQLRGCARDCKECMRVSSKALDAAGKGE